MHSIHFKLGISQTLTFASFAVRFNYLQRPSSIVPKLRMLRSFVRPSGHLTITGFKYRTGELLVFAVRRSDRWWSPYITGEGHQAHSSCELQSVWGIGQILSEGCHDGTHLSCLSFHSSRVRAWVGPNGSFFSTFGLLCGVSRMGRCFFLFLKKAIQRWYNNKTSLSLKVLIPTVKVLFSYPCLRCWRETECLHFR